MSAPNRGPEEGKPPEMWNYQCLSLPAYRPINESGRGLAPAHILTQNALFALCAATITPFLRINRRVFSRLQRSISDSSLLEC